MFNTFIAFILTGIVGTWISYFWQKRNWRGQHDFLTKNKRVEKQIEIIEQLSNLINKRRYRMMRVLDALKFKDIKKIDNSWSDYDKIVFEWNDNIGTYIVFIKEYFSKDLAYSFERDIIARFKRCGDVLQRIKNSKDVKKNITNEIISLDKEILDLYGHYVHFTGGLWRYMEEYKCILNGEMDITIKNKRYLSYTYLIKNIFVPRI